MPPSALNDRPVVSLPALAAALRQSDDHGFVPSTADTLLAQDLVQAYRVDSRPEQEASSAAQVVAQVLDRLQRLAGAYGEWQDFDPSAFFDLHPPQAEMLVQISERVSTVHVVFHADLLLPAFQEAERYWSRRFVPAYQAAAPSLRSGTGDAFAQTFGGEIQPGMVERWQRLVAVIQAARSILVDDLSFLVATGGESERYRWRRAWQMDAPAPLDPALLPDFDQLPTLTLALTFPLPTSRQPGRTRRLRRRWEQRGRGPRNHGRRAA